VTISITSFPKFGHTRAAAKLELLFKNQPQGQVYKTKNSSMDKLQQDTTWAWFSTLEVAACMPSTYVVANQNCPALS